MPHASRFVTLQRYVAGYALDETCFSLGERPVAKAGKGQVLVQALALSVDPYLRSRMTGLDNYYLPQFHLGEPIESIGVGRVVESHDSRYRAGDIVQGLIEWADYSVWAGAGKLEGGGALRHVANDIRKITHALGVYGLNGLTALFGVMMVARPRAGEAMLISGAAGGIGTIAGQIANILGARVIGLAGTDEKCGILVKQLGFHAALNYRTSTMVEELSALTPNGPDIYFDNVGGALSQTVMWHMQRPGRVVECGQIATYDDQDGGWKVDIRPLHAKGLRWESFTTAHFDDYAPAALAQLAHWVQSGKIIPLETEYHGLENAPRAMIGLLRGENMGKMVVTLE